MQTAAFGIHDERRDHETQQDPSEAGAKHTEGGWSHTTVSQAFVHSP